jgi:hypothetical protein
MEKLDFLCGTDVLGCTKNDLVYAAQERILIPKLVSEIYGRC